MHVFLFFFFPWLVIPTGMTKTPLGTFTWILAFMLLVSLHHNMDVLGHKQSKAGVWIKKRAQGHNCRSHSAWQNYRYFSIGEGSPVLSSPDRDLPWVIHSCWSPGCSSRHQPCSPPRGNSLSDLSLGCYLCYLDLARLKIFFLFPSFMTWIRNFLSVWKVSAL